ncbi:MAG: hypothetical protein EZS28_004004 [Streblomastix strix]|uniref:Uncharacterized protein n=1 Tax=Streblomastix strix TaxID=222440 RepID=A0A5J4X1G3_9EUKA|nr:MAG: hypothetical protein EZS28_004004 [Streblomastix strix]
MLNQLIYPPEFLQIDAGNPILLPSVGNIASGILPISYVLVVYPFVSKYGLNTHTLQVPSSAIQYVLQTCPPRSNEFDSNGSVGNAFGSSIETTTQFGVNTGETEVMSFVLSSSAKSYYCFIILTRARWIRFFILLQQILLF